MKNKKSLLNILFIFLSAVVAILIVSLFYRNIWLTALLLVIFSIIFLIKWKSKTTLYVFILAGIAGAIAEMIAIYFGVWNYAFPNFINIPIWLFILWGDAAAGIYHLGLEIKNMRGKE